jgi:hypothetical protein
MPQAAKNLKRVGEALQASRWTAEGIDRKYGTKVQLVIDGMARQYNDLHAYIRPRAEEISDLITKTNAQKIDSNALYRELTTGQNTDNPINKGWRTFFDGVIDDARALGIDIQKRENYLPTKLLPSDEIAAALTNRARELKDKGILDIANQAIDEKQLELLNKNPEVKELFASLDKLVPGKGDYSTKFLTAVDDAREGTIRNFGTARALKRSEDAGDLPDLIKDKDVGRLAQNWVESVFKSGVMRQSLMEIRDAADLMKRIGDQNSSRYLENLLADINGYARNGSIGKDLAELKKRTAAYMQEKALEQTNPVAKQLYQSSTVISDLGAMLHQTMYANALGSSTKQVVTNISSIITMTLPELGYVQGGKLASKALLKVANAYMRGQNIVVKSPEVARKLKVKVGDTAKVRGMKLVLQNEGLASSQFNDTLQRSIVQGLQSKGLPTGVKKAVGKFNNTAMFLFESSEVIMRGMTKYIADDLAKLHGTGAQDYETFLKTLPRAYRQAVDGAKTLQDRQRILTDYIVSKTVFNYNQASASEVARALGPGLSSFSRWPTEIGGAEANNFAKNGFTSGMADLLYRRFAPLWGLMLVSGILGIEDSDKDSPLYYFVRRDNLKYMSPLSSLASIFEGDVAPPILSIPAQAAKAAVTSDPAAAGKVVKDAARLYIPGASLYSSLVKEFSEDKK